VRWTGVPPGRSVSRRLDWVAFTRDAARRGLGCYFVIVESPAASGALLGAIDVRFVDREDPRIGEVGYLLPAASRGRGVMAAAMRLLLDWSFGEPLRLERVQALTHPDNVPSQRVLERAGFSREGLLRAYRAEPGGREDRVMWSLLAIDWRSP
jgi:RimJ/RimL family protein N-acetyltransferase